MVETANPGRHAASVTLHPSLIEEHPARPAPLAVVIFGASGDLTGRKLMPALYNLYNSRFLPESFYIMGAARTEMSLESFRQKMTDSIAAAGADPEVCKRFMARLHYHTLTYDRSEDYRALGEKLEGLDREFGVGGNRVFNLAIPPSLYATVAGKLGEAGLSREAPESGTWVRLVVEKPFGRDLASARELNRALGESFREHQVFRIDHYLAKDTVQNIMMFRFANSIFEPLWNRNYIDYVSIAASETLGVEHRAGYYEQAGVLRDMFQNHMLQLLALVAAEPPSLFAADRVRDERSKVFRSLRPFPLEIMYDHLVLGQYLAGESEGNQVPGYREEPLVDDGSLTPTYAAMQLFVDNWRWQGVPFYLASGKRLKKKITRIQIQFREVPHSMFREVLEERISANRLTLGVHPDEVINLSFQSKRPGQEPALRRVTMSFDYQQNHDAPRLEAYEKSLADAMRGDQMLFWRQDGLELTWDFLDPVLNECESCRDRAGNLHRYAAGSWGPEAAEKLLPRGFWNGEGA